MRAAHSGRPDFFTHLRSRIERRDLDADEAVALLLVLSDLRANAEATAVGDHLERLRPRRFVTPGGHERHHQMFLVDRRLHALFQTLDLDGREVWKRFETGLDKLLADHERAAAAHAADGSPGSCVAGAEWRRLARRTPDR